MIGEAYGKIRFFSRHWFKARWTITTPPEDVNRLFEQFLDKYKMSKAKLHEFLVSYQKVKEDDADKLAERIIGSRNLKVFANFRRNYLSSNGFFQYLLSHKNHPLNVEDLDYRNDLVKYFVYTSRHTCLKQKRHKTHLAWRTAKHILNITYDDTAEKEKIYHYNSMNAIEKALEEGVRVIELDLCQSSDKSHIVVSHPRAEGQSHSTMTLKKCLEAISEKAFVTSEFPLMMILVMHFDPSVDKLELKIEKLIETIFKDKRSTLTEALQKPLDSLKRKFIIVTKRYSPSADKNDNEPYLIVDYNKNLDEKIHTKTKTQLEDATGTEYTSMTRQELLAVYPNSDPVITSKSNPLNSSTQGAQTDTSKPDSAIPSNFDPLIGWIHGAQMVTSNIQDPGKHLWVMQGLFRAQQAGNKPTGYVRKPDILLEPNPIFNPIEWRPVKKILKVKVYLGTGWHLDFGKEFDETSAPDFFAAVEIAGVPADEAREKTVPAMDQWVPSWNQEFTFPLTVPELAMLVIEVKEFDPDRSHEFGGQTCLPVCKLKPGIRSVPLYNRKGKRLRSARLLMRFTLH